MRDVTPRQRGERRHAFEALARPVAVHRLEVVEAPGARRSRSSSANCTRCDELVPVIRCCATSSPNCIVARYSACARSRADRG